MEPLDISFLREDLLIMIGTTELIVIVLVILVLFGASAIPKFARSLGEAKKEFTKAMKEGEEEKPDAPEKKSGAKKDA
jgi:sec-independent protein translocase protein TatA